MPRRTLALIWMLILASLVLAGLHVQLVLTPVEAPAVVMPHAEMSPDACQIIGNALVCILAVADNTQPYTP